MLHKKFIALILMLISYPAFADYDVNKIKDGIEKKTTVFQVTGWSQSQDQKSFIATTQLKRLSITVNEKESKLIVPFVTPEQIKTGKVLCRKFTEVASAADSQKQLQDIKDTIRKSTTRHQLKRIKMNDIVFMIAPKLRGSVVSLHCSVSKI